MSDNARDPLAEWQDPGQEGKTFANPGELEAEVRVHRHDLKLLKTAVDGQGELVRMGIDRADRANETAIRADARGEELMHAVFGHPGRLNDGGALGAISVQMSEMKNSLSSQSKQNWAILLAILGLIGTLAVVFR